VRAVVIGGGQAGVATGFYLRPASATLSGVGQTIRRLAADIV
jgi:cation diffusion facilitator CzcD-associated flavoprotein CzcO